MAFPLEPGGPGQSLTWLYTAAYLNIFILITPKTNNRMVHVQRRTGPFHILSSLRVKRLVEIQIQSITCITV